MDKKNSSITGFMNGYKAGNLSSLASLFNFKKAEIGSHLDNLFYNFPDDSTTEAKKFYSEIKSLKITLHSGLDSFDTMVSLGESINIMVNTYKSLNNPTKEIVLPDLKKIAYHFIDLAKRAEDQKVIDVAIKIGEKF